MLHMIFLIQLIPDYYCCSQNILILINYMNTFFVIPGGGKNYLLWESEIHCQKLHLKIIIIVIFILFKCQSSHIFVRWSYLSAQMKGKYAYDIVTYFYIIFCSIDAVLSLSLMCRWWFMDTIMYPDPGWVSETWRARRSEVPGSVWHHQHHGAHRRSQESLQRAGGRSSKADELRLGSDRTLWLNEAVLHQRHWE